MMTIREFLSIDDPRSLWWVANRRLPLVYCSDFVETRVDEYTATFAVPATGVTKYFANGKPISPSFIGIRDNRPTAVYFDDVDLAPYKNCIPTITYE